MSWIFFSLITYACYSITNFIEKFLIDKKIRYPSTVTIISGIFSLFIGIFLFFLRGRHVLPPLQILLLVLSGVLLTMYLIPYFHALSLEDASRVVPLFQFFPLFVLVIAFIFLHETLTVKQLLGFIFVSCAGLMLAVETINRKIFRLRKAFWYMLLASFLYALTNILFKFIFVRDFWLMISYQTIGIGIGAFLLFLYNPYRKHFFQEIKTFDSHIFQIITINTGFGFLAGLTNFYAITLAPVALVSVMQGTQPFFLIIYGFLLTRFFPHLIKEDISKKTLILKLVAICILFSGIYIIDI